MKMASPRAIEKMSAPPVVYHGREKPWMSGEAKKARLEATVFSTCGGGCQERGHQGGGRGWGGGGGSHGGMG